MAISEELRRYLDERSSQARVDEDYYLKIHPLDVSDDTELWSVRGNSQVITLDLTKGQRAGVVHILGEAGIVVRRDKDGKVIESHLVTVGEVRHLNDDELLKLTSKKGSRVIRALFGRSEEIIP